ncbi:atpG, partial [Symbiodinium necroappetens]
MSGTVELPPEESTLLRASRGLGVAFWAVAIANGLYMIFTLRSQSFWPGLHNLCAGLLLVLVASASGVWEVKAMRSRLDESEGCRWLSKLAFHRLRASVLSGLCRFRSAAMVSTKRGSFGATVAVGLALVAAWSCLWRHEEDFVSGVSVQPRESLMTRCAVDKAMKDRIASVAKTAKLTDAMRVVAAAKVRNAQNGVEKQRPFTDELLSMIKGLVKRLKGSGFEAELPMLRVPEKVKNVGILMITANRGLCG